MIKDTDFVGGFAKGLAVIAAFSEAGQRLSIAEGSRLTGFDRATVRRLLLTLAELGYASYDGKFFALTPKILRLGHAYFAGTSLPALIQPHLDLLSERTGQSSSASVLDGTDIVYVARAAQRRIMSINLMPGSRLPAWCSSMGRVLLAALPEEEARAILEASDIGARTPKTRTGLSELVEELGRVRQQDHALIDEELELGLQSIAVPIRNVRGTVVAAINIGAPTAQTVTTSLVAHLPMMREVQRALQPLLA